MGRVSDGFCRRVHRISIQVMQPDFLEFSAYLTGILTDLTEKVVTDITDGDLQKAKLVEAATVLSSWPNEGCAQSQAK